MSDASLGNAVARFFGNALFAIGTLVLVLSGACTGLGLLFGIFGVLTSGGRDAGLYFVYVLVIGAPPILVSLGMFFLGRWILRRNPRATGAVPPQDQP